MVVRRRGGVAALAVTGAGLAARRSVFDLYIRRIPFNGGYAIAAGLEDYCRSYNIKDINDIVGSLQI